MIERSTWTLRKWRAVFGIYIQDGVAYRASMFIWIMTDVITAVTMPLVWARASGNGVIAGYTAGDFVLYYLCLLLLQNFVTSHMMWDIAMEIKEGQFTLALVRPISFFQFTFMRNLAWRFLRLVLFTPIFGVLVWMYHPFLLNVHLHLGWEFWVAVLLGHLVSISFVLMMSMLALFVQEAQSIFELYYVPMLFLSGQLFPVSVMPGWVRSIVPFFPFYFTTGAPTEILVGRVSGDAAIHVIAMQLMWIGIAVVVGKVLWRYGLRQYTAVGM